MIEPRNPSFHNNKAFATRKLARIKVRYQALFRHPRKGVKTNIRCFLQSRSGLLDFSSSPSRARLLHPISTAPSQTFPCLLNPSDISVLPRSQRLPRLRLIDACFLGLAETSHLQFLAFRTRSRFDNIFCPPSSKERFVFFVVFLGNTADRFYTYPKDHKQSQEPLLIKDICSSHYTTTTRLSSDLDEELKLIRLIIDTMHSVNLFSAILAVASLASGKRDFQILSRVQHSAI